MTIRGRSAVVRRSFAAVPLIAVLAFGGRVTPPQVCVIGADVGPTIRVGGDRFVSRSPRSW